MTARQAYEAVLIELNKENAPNILLEDFNYLFNKAINQYINKRYNIYDISQQTTDDLRVLKASSVLQPQKAGMYKENDFGRMMGATYEVNLPSDYLHLLNCICIYEVKKTFKCYNQGDIWRRAATRLTADVYSQVLDNFWLRPTYRRPYYYIHNVNYDTTNEEWTSNPPTNPYNNGKGTDVIGTTNELLETSHENEVRKMITDGILAYPTRIVSGIIDSTKEWGISSSHRNNGDRALIGFTGILPNTNNTIDNSPVIIEAYELNSNYTFIPVTNGNSTSVNEGDEYFINTSFEKTEDNKTYKIRAIGKYIAGKNSDSLTGTQGEGWKQIGVIYDKYLVTTNGGEESLLLVKHEVYYGDIKETPDISVNDGDAWYTPILNTDSVSLFNKINYNGEESSNIERASKVRYGNSSRVRLEIRYGTDDRLFTLKKVYIDYIKAPQNIRLTQTQLDVTEDTSQMLEFPDYVCLEIINELVNIVMENISDLRLQTHPVVSLSIANPAQQLSQAALAAQ